MILPESRSIKWLQKIAKKNNFPNITILEKAVRAFSLLESLALSGCPFIFKGGTALMLHLNNPKRLSIDIDIICPPGTKIESYLTQNAGQYGFNKIELVERHTVHTIPKSHVKFHYQVAYKTNNVTDYILLDVLFENNHYNKLVSLPIENQFLKTAGEPIFVQTPSKEDLLGDKLTAFAPNITGIPYYKKGQLYTMEIIKQLYDIASLFDFTNDLSTTTETFYKYAKIELAYRSLDVNNVQQVLDDIFQTSLCICLKGQTNKEQFFLLQDGIKRIQSFIYSERYVLETAIINASKAAYLSTLITNNMNMIEHFNENTISELKNKSIANPLPSKLNKLKKTNIEAFYYWVKIYEIIKEN
ncbi:MAG TPA: nucleotidyl transferase AbiEii/AbiGii toxin family protein [Bacteroidales bacterium]|nr:nucleotidyl transferase AbiEii/AbiGii toxin family protein [Bacteroidales bacterium]HPZ04327.1 nucleotidyl transferase AbiEii/AbiGii toxin family protein [Bacteroidales bacterium]HQB75913.1 nucleotidyl transferase AbiEii/AbiGii toxin family protein [Bacteroidales bacterium]